MPKRRDRLRIGSTRCTTSEAPPCFRRVGMPAPDFVGLGHGVRASEALADPDVRRDQWHPGTLLNLVSLCLGGDE